MTAVQRENRNPIVAIWEYIKQMNSGPEGRLSIKRNMAWGLATLAAFVEIYSLIVLPHITDGQMTMYIGLCKFYAVCDLLFVVLALGITTFEKLSELAKQISGRFGGGSQNDKTPDPAPAPTPQLSVVTNIEQTS